MIKLDLLLIDTHTPYALAIADFSTYPANYTPISPTIYICGGGFPEVTLEFTPNSVNVYNSENLGITCDGADLVALPDGLYHIKYTINPAYQNFVNKTFLKIDNLQEKFDTAFMKLDMMECDMAIKKQRKVELDTIDFYIQGAIAAANKCADDISSKLYRKADRMLNQFIENKCNCNA
jgi:hypothetical protein